MSKASQWSSPIVQAKRRSMGLARKRRIHQMREGTCWSCGTDGLPVTGPGVIYEHRPPLALLEKDEDKRVYLSCKSCADAVTPQDISDVARAKRRQAKNEGTRKRKGPKLKGRGFRKDPLRKRGLDGKVKDR